VPAFSELHPSLACTSACSAVKGTISIFALAAEGQFPRFRAALCVPESRLKFPGEKLKTGADVERRDMAAVKRSASGSWSRMASKAERR